MVGRVAGYQDLSLTNYVDNVADRDGTDQLRNVQILRFADGDVVLDEERQSAQYRWILFRWSITAHCR